jgi:hypothetical protein
VLAFDLTLDPAESVRATREVERRGRTVGSRLLSAGAMAFPILFALWSGVPNVLLPVYIALLIIYGLWTLALPTLRTRHLAKLYRSSPALSAVQRYEFTDEGLRMSNPEASTFIRWTSFVKAVESRDFYFLYYLPKRAYFLPRRVVTAQQKDDALRAFLRGKLGPRAELTSPPAGSA